MASIASDFDTERQRLAELTRRGIGMPAAGLLYWIAVALLVRAMPMKSALIWSFIATGAVFPVGVVLTKLSGGDLFAKSKALTPLGLMLNAVQLFYWPVIIVVFTVAPEWTPFALAVLFSSHFLPYAWLYRSPGYATLAVATTVIVTVGVIVTGGPLYATVPILTAATYAVSVALLAREVITTQSPRSDSTGSTLEARRAGT
jgi:hypothetical protein